MKGLDWTNETWVRLYRTDSPAWKRLKWEAQSVYLGLQRKLNRAGCLSLDGLLDFEAVAEMVGCPEDVAERALPRLYQLGFLVKSGDGDLIVDPEFMERDEAASSDAQRKRDSRERQRDRGMSRNVTPESRNVTKASHSVTTGHTRSLLDEPSPEETKKKNPPSGDPPAGGTTPAKPLNPQAQKVKRLEEFFAAHDTKPPKPSVLSTWLAKQGGDVQKTLAFLEDMHGKGKLGQHSFCWEVIQDWQPRRKPVQGNGQPEADFDWTAAAEARAAEDERLEPFRLALAQAEREHGEESPEYDAALLALMEAQE